MKKLMILLTTLVLVLLLSLASADQLPMVVDHAGLFSTSEIAAMENAISGIRDSYQMDVVVLTVSLNRMSDRALQDYADRYYEDNGYGLGEDKAGALIMIDMGNRYTHISTAGALIPYLNDSRQDKILDQGADYMSKGRYGDGVNAMLKRLRQYIASGVKDGIFYYDQQTGRRLSGSINRLTSGEIMFSLLAGALVTLIIMLSVRSRYSLRTSTYSFNKSTQSAMKLDVNDAQFLRQTVRRIPRNTGSSGGPGHGGGGNGVSVHSSSSGTTHGGGGRHF